MSKIKNMKIIYNDNCIIVCIKPAGAVSTDEPGGMPELIRNELDDPRADVRCVHRLDRAVSGLMVFARSSDSAAELSRQISGRSFDKEYLAVVKGCPVPSEGRMDDLLFRNSSENKTYVVSRMRKGVREASLEYKVLGSKEGMSLVRIKLLTGRTHQIRAQFSSRGMPLAGDRKYGSADTQCGIALWSCELSFTHPLTGKQLEFSAMPPKEYPWSLFEFCEERAPEEAELPERRAFREENSHVPCPNAKKCGGCQMQNLQYGRQLAVKQKKMKELLGRFGTVLPIIGMNDPYHYRCKVAAAFGLDAKGKIISGVYQPASHRIVPVDSCMIEDKAADAIIVTIRSMLRDFKIPVYSELRDSGWLRHVLVRRGHATGEVMVVMVVTDPIFKLQKPFLKELLQRHPEITTVVLNINDRFTPVILGQRDKVIYGPGYIEDVLCGFRFRISPKSFYQVNPVQTEILYSTAIEFAGLTGKETVLDAYCGTGTIGICASRQAKSVTGVELNHDAVKDAIVNAKINSTGNCCFTCGDAGQFMDAAAKEGESFDVVFMDPPRSGSDERFCSSLVRMRPKKIVYISCGPESLAADLERLTAGGYIVQKIQPVDMFPFTEHIETVVLLSKAHRQ